MVESIGRESYSPIMNCAILVCLSIVPARGRTTEGDGVDNAWAGLGQRMQEGLH